MKTTATWLPSLISAVVVLSASFSPQIQDYLSAHPVVMAIVAGAYAVLSHLLPSPVTGGKDK